MKEEEVIINTKVIYKFINDVSTDDIYPHSYLDDPLPPTPMAGAFGNNKLLNQKLIELGQNESIAIVCNGNFGSGLHSDYALLVLQSYNLTIVAKSIDAVFFANYGPTLKSKLIQCGTLNAGDLEVNDELEIHTFKLIQKRQFDTTHFTSSESSEGDVKASKE